MPNLGITKKANASACVTLRNGSGTFRISVMAHTKYCGSTRDKHEIELTVRHFDTD